MTGSEVTRRRVVRYHPPTGHSLLFRPLPKSRTRPVLDVCYLLPDDVTLHFSAREALGAPEQTLLLAILEIAEEQHANRPRDTLISQQVNDTRGQQLWRGLYPTGQGNGLQSLRISTTWEEINRRCGAGNGGSIIQSRRRSLRRLCEVVVWEENASARTMQQSFLLVLLLGDDQRLHLALNHRLASAMLGGSYAQLCLDERQRLGQDAAMVVHAFLSTWLRPGSSNRITVDTLMTRLWPDEFADVVPDGTLRRRRRDVRSALDQIGRLPLWEISWEKEGRMAKVKRHHYGVREMTGPRHFATADASFGEPDAAGDSLPVSSLPHYDVSVIFSKKN